MPDFSKRSEAQIWLELYAQEVIVAFAVRSAMRTVPIISEGLKGKGRGSAAKRLRKTISLPIFRNVATAWVSAVQPNRLLPSIAGPAATIAYVAGTSSSDVRIRAAVASASAACDAAADITARGAAAYAAAAVYAAGRLHEDCTIAAYQDSLLVEQATSLATLPLWQAAPPAWALEGWQRLKDSLLAADEQWEVWTDWYESRVVGEPGDGPLEWDRVTLPETVWKQTPKRVNAHIDTLVQQYRTRKTPEPLDNIPSPFVFQLSARHTIAVAASPASTPIFPLATSKKQHAKLLEVCETLASDLVKELRAGKFQAREEYCHSLERYSERLPRQPKDGNVLLADAEARTLRSLFAGEVDILNIAFAAKLKTFLEQHMGLRVYYPEIADFYRHVQTGRIEAALPLDAIEGLVKTVRDHTPSVFDTTVGEAMVGSSSLPPMMIELSSPDLPPKDEHQPVPPIDPLGEIDLRKARDFTIAGTINNLWKAFLQGEKLYKSLDGWKKAGDSLRPYVADIITWLHKFLETVDRQPPSAGG